MNIGLNYARREFVGENWSATILANATTALWDYTIPSGIDLEITEFGNYMGDVAAWGTNYFYATANGVPFELAGGFPLIYDQVGYAAQRQTISPKRFNGGTRIIIYAVEAKGFNVAMGISIGYFNLFKK